MSTQDTLNIRGIDPAIVHAFKVGAMGAGMSHGEWLAELVKEGEGGQRG